MADTPQCRSPNCDPDECARGCWMRGSTVEASDMPLHAVPGLSDRKVDAAIVKLLGWRCATASVSAADFEEFVIPALVARGLLEKYAEFLLWSVFESEASGVLYTPPPYQWMAMCMRAPLDLRARAALTVLEAGKRDAMTNE